MSIYKSTKHIISNPYEKMPANLDSRFGYYRVDTKVINSFNIDEVKMWEQIYYEPGFVGVYAAYDPYVEFYMITYNIFIDRPLGIETFFGNDAVEKVIDKTKKLGINLKIYTTN
jgi:hypothetical protein